MVNTPVANVYGGTMAYLDTNSSTMEFSFKGTSILLMGWLNNSFSNNVTITIDGVDETISFLNNVGATSASSVCYVKTGLSDTMHSFKLKNNTNLSVRIDAIDINETGYISLLGKQLTIPEAGWRRYDDTDSRILYLVAGWSRTTIAGSYYGDTSNSSNQGADSIKFKFYGTKIRIIDTKGSGGDSIKIIIDGFEEIYNRYNATAIYKILVYENLNLSQGVHTVEIKNVTEGKVIALDAIDIDSTGYLVHPILNQVLDLYSMEEGDCIPIRYTAATSGTPGYFSELGTCTANEIPITGSATPDGSAYFIKVAPGLLISDRVVQHSISWDALNSNGYIEGSTNAINEIPAMTSCTSPRGTVFTNTQETTGADSYYAFNGKNNDYWCTKLE